MLSLSEILQDIFMMDKSHPPITFFLSLFKIKVKAQSFILNISTSKEQSCSNNVSSRHKTTFLAVEGSCQKAQIWIYTCQQF